MNSPGAGQIFNFAKKNNSYIGLYPPMEHVPLEKNYKFVLHPEIMGVEPLLMNDPLMNLPTTIDIADGMIYILANSQMDNLNQETNEIKDKDKLTNTYILKYKINN